MNKIPIIILNWNGIEETLHCIQSLEKQSEQNFLIYLVDNGSTGDDVEILKHEFANDPKITLIFNEENLGFTKGNNAVMSKLLEMDSYEYIVLLNNDTEVDTDWLKNLVKSAKENKADMVASKMIDFYDRDKMDNAGHIMLNTGEVLPLGHGEDVKKYMNSFENFGACAGACLYSTKLLKDIGLFDSYFLNGYEDVELGVRAVLSGHKSVFEPKAIVYHKGSVSINKIRDFSFAVKAQNNISYTYLKTMPLLVILLNLPFTILKYILLLFGSVIFLRFKILKTIYNSMLEIISYDRNKLMGSRKEFIHKVRLSTFEILLKQTFFLGYYIRYFLIYIIGGKATVLERY